MEGCAVLRYCVVVGPHEQDHCWLLSLEFMHCRDTTSNNLFLLEWGATCVAEVEQGATMEEWFEHASRAWKKRLVLRFLITRHQVLRREQRLFLLTPHKYALCGGAFHHV